MSELSKTLSKMAKGRGKLFTTILMAQPLNFEPYLHAKIQLPKEEEEKSWPFTNIGDVAWKVALELDKNAKMSIIGLSELFGKLIKTAWLRTGGESGGLLITIRQLNILLFLDRYRGLSNKPSNYIMGLYLEGKPEACARFAKKFVDELGYPPWEGIGYKRLAKWAMGTPTFLGFDLTRDIHAERIMTEVQETWLDLLQIAEKRRGKRRKKRLMAEVQETWLDLLRIPGKRRGKKRPP